MLLPDINVWLALTFDSHAHHAASKRWFDALGDEICYFCRMTQQGFLRLSTDKKIFDVHALTLQQAWLTYDSFRDDARISYAGEPEGIEIRWRDFTQHQSNSPRVWNDAYLAAFAITNGLEMVTFDNGFSQYANLKCTILS